MEEVIIKIDWKEHRVKVKVTSEGKVNVYLRNEVFEVETKQVMENLKAVLAAVDMTFEDVFKTTIFISDMNNFSQINAIYGTYFNEETAPARETVEVANLPKFVNVEISVIATK